ncbi:MAG: hypothetical protein H0T44_04010 [Gemmatimonadales bacterium]|nr:hypothetical protein [Gemmatimonadales bacterium]MDQ3428057.1 hypothetical protein [Gemmatimonadota bacterium]
MGATFVVLLLSATVAQTPPSDSAPAYANPATRHLVERAMARRQAGDSSVNDYRARLHYRLTVGVGRRRWARVPTSAVEEQVAEVQWRRPNDLRLDIVGRRSRSRSTAVRLSSVWDRPWFVPRGVDDSVRIFSDEFPATGALHPLAAGGPEWYRYELSGNLGVAPARGGTLRLMRVEVTPRRTGPALIAGQMWIDSATAEVVRLTFRYVGTALWAEPEGSKGSDSSSARRINSIANRIVSIDADLEYGLQDGRYWMPYRQVVAGRVRIPVVSDVVIPFQATTTFQDYQINTGRPIAFEVPLPDSARWDANSRREARRERRDSLRAERRGQESERGDSLRSWDYADRWAGGRYELHRPSNDSLTRYVGWGDSLSLDEDPADVRRVREVEAELARMAEELPGPLTGESNHGIAYERASDVLRYDRVQGLSLGVGYRVRAPGVRFTGLYGTVRYGLSDERVTGRLTVLRDAPGGRLALSGYREIADVDPFSPGHGIGNTLNALFAAHDNADYALVHGGSAGFETSLGTGLDLGLGARVERQTSVGREARSAINDFFGGSGLFPTNPPVQDGTFVGGWARLTGVKETRWSVTGDVLSGEGQTTGRLFGEVRRGIGRRRGLTLRLKGGLATASAPPQSLFRLGGLATVRGFDYGSRRGEAFWATQLDLAPFSGRLRPVLFLDAGQAGETGDIFASKALIGGGAGLSLFNGLLRLDLSHPISEGGSLRFDIVVQGVR